MTPPPDVPAPGRTVGAALSAIEQRLRASGQTDAGPVAEQALAYLLDIRPLDVHLRARTFLSPGDQAKLDLLTRRLLRHEPIQYVLGFAEFMGRRFACDRRALIPRPETELLVETAIQHPALAKVPGPRIADIGTGSGIIAVSLALAFANAEIVATDIRSDTLDLARENARRHGVDSRITWYESDLLPPGPAGTFDGILANLPYVDSAEYEHLDPRILRYEPRIALDGGPGGLVLIERLAQQARTALRPGGLLLLEIGEDQGPRGQTLLKQKGFHGLFVRRDLAGHDRVLGAMRAPESVPNGMVFSFGFEKRGKS